MTDPQSHTRLLRSCEQIPVCGHVLAGVKTHCIDHSSVLTAYRGVSRRQRRDGVGICGTYNVACVSFADALAPMMKLADVGILPKWVPDRYRKAPLDQGYS